MMVDHPYSYPYNITINRMNARTLNWVTDPSDKRLAIVRGMLLKALDEHSKHNITYYDFLLVAKQSNLRFQESAHLMELRKHFFAHKNQLNNHKIVAMLSVEQECLKDVTPEHLPSKIIIRFKLGQIEAIKEVTNQDEEVGEEEEQVPQIEGTPSQYPQRIGPRRDTLTEEENEEYREKMRIILSIKVAEMVRKLRLLLEGIPDQDQQLTLLSIFQPLSITHIPFQLFKKGVVGLLRKMEGEFFRQKLTMSEQDIRAVFAVLDEHDNGQVQKESLNQLKDEASFLRKMSQFYEGRINRRMVKNTLFKLGKNSNSIQIYQVKNASVLEFRTMEQGLLDGVRRKERPRGKIPHFGPIKGSGLRQSPSNRRQNQNHYLQHQKRGNHSSLSTYKRPEEQLDKERSRIQRIIRTSKEDKKKSDKDTVANKLRKLFIHKVILPREKLLEQEKQKYGGGRATSHSAQMVVKMV